MLCWPGYEERDVIGPFEDEMKTKVEFKTYIGGEQMMQFYARRRPAPMDAIIADCRIYRQAEGQRCGGILLDRRFPEIKNYHPGLCRFRAHARGRGQGLRPSPPSFFFYGISYKQGHHEPGRGVMTGTRVPAENYGEDHGIFDWYLPEYGQCQPGREPRPRQSLRYSGDQARRSRLNG